MNWYTRFLSKLAAPAKRPTPNPKAPKGSEPPPTSDLSDAYEREMARQQEAREMEEMNGGDKIAQFGPISQTMNIKSVVGLIPPPGNPTAPPFLWVTHEGKPPALIRFTWNPSTGDLYIGTEQFHSYQLGRGLSSRQAEYVRGFYLPLKHTVAIRPYHNPSSVYDTRFTAEDRALSDRIMQSMGGMFRKALGQYVPDLKIDLGREGVGGVDNNYMKGEYGDLATRW